MSACWPSPGSFRRESGFFTLGKASAFTTARLLRRRTSPIPSTDCKTISAACRDRTCKTSKSTPRMTIPVLLTTKNPNALMLSRLETRFIVSKDAGDQLDNHTNGTGPYKYVSWQRGGSLVLRRNDDYWGTKAQIKEVILKGVKEEAARVAGLLAGQADVISNLPIEDIERVGKHPRNRVEKVVGFRMYFLG